MKLSLTIEGNSTKKTTKLIKDQMTIGRKNADFIITDPSASGIHATVVFRSGAFYLLDNQSKNGTFVKDKLVNEVPLRLGASFRIGKTHFRVIETTEEERVELPDPEWFEVLEDFTKNSGKSLKNSPASVLPINPGLKLSFLKGLQESTVWHIGYGPRAIGAKEYHFSILDPEAPDKCFSIHPTEGGALIKDESQGVVQVNNQNFDQHILCGGDEISFLNNIILVELVDAAD